jgi:hypothetical protein
VLDENSCAGGPTARAVKQAQKPTLGDGYTSLAVSSAAEIVSTVAASGTGVVSGIVAMCAGPFFTAGTLIFELGRARHEGRQLNEAYRRDAANLAFVWVAAQALPERYVASKAEELKASGGPHGPANKILTPLMKDDAAWQKLVKETNEGVTQMRRSGAQLGIHSKASLRAALATHPTLERAYNNNLILRHAFDSLVIEGERTAPSR